MRLGISPKMTGPNWSHFAAFLWNFGHRCYTPTHASSCPAQSAHASCARIITIPFMPLDPRTFTKWLIKHNSSSIIEHNWFLSNLISDLNPLYSNKTVSSFFAILLRTQHARLVICDTRCHIVYMCALYSQIVWLIWHLYDFITTYCLLSQADTSMVTGSVWSVFLCR